MTPHEYARFFESLTPETPLEAFRDCFDDYAGFSDPFHTVIGVEAIYQVFEKMYADLYKPRFKIDEVIANDDVAYIRWHFFYRFKEHGAPQNFSGVSRVEFSSSGKVLKHTDYWDAASNLYEHLPLIGSIMRFIKERIRR
jgi:hypothetical protein